FSDFFGGGRGGGFEDLFSDFFGARRGRRSGRRQRKGSDLRVTFEVDLEDIRSGTEKTIKLNRKTHCDACGGSGSESGGTETCPKCEGRGEVRTVQRNGFQQLIRVSACPECGGTGEIVENPCSKCKGTGVVDKRETITIKVPPGARDGSRLRLRGKGDAGKRGAPAGDLYVQLRIKPHDVFKRLGNDILMDVDISMTQAALGEKIKVPTLKGKTNVKIPAGIQPGETVGLKGKGLPDSRGNYGKQIIRVNVKVPKKLDKKQKELLKEFREIEKERDKSFFDKIRGK
ncbi:MAG: DnaJ C-terminal domain-containing protein, partial [Thermoplasmatota archaeon]